MPAKNKNKNWIWFRILVPRLKVQLTNRGTSFFALKMSSLQ